MSDKTENSVEAPVGALLVAQAMSGGDSSMRYKAMQAVKDWDRTRLAVKPGITGWWQVTDRNDTDFDGMVRRDLEYIAKRGVATDLKIVALTVVEMITGGGAC